MKNFTIEKKDLGLLIIGLVLIISGLLITYFDPEAYGFGVLTLWYAPWLLVTGYVVIAWGLLSHVLVMRKIKAMVSVPMDSDAKWKYGLALLSGLLSFVIYVMTVAPTANFWDCGEFIAAAYKLEIPHTPGNPFFLLIGRLFTMMSFGDVTQVAWTMNIMSALFASLTVIIAFLLIYQTGQQKTYSNKILLLAAFVGSQTLAYIDSFWFSAVEAEAYAMASFFMLWIFYCSLKMKCITDSQEKTRVLMFNIFMLAIAYCVHPMCLLVLPCMVMCYLSGSTYNLKKQLLGFGIGMALILFINSIVIIWPIEWALWLDIQLVNIGSFPQFSGTWLVILLAIIACIILYRLFRQSRVSLILLIVFYLGLTPYIFLFIRSAQNPPLDSGSPDNMPGILAYMKREQYGTVPMVYGHYYDANITAIETGGAVYDILDEKYLQVAEETEYEYDSSRKTILPRMYSNDAQHVKAYQQWTGLEDDQQPRFRNNLQFLLQYQLGHMYLRYLFWNFVGRNGDKQDATIKWPWTRNNENNQAINQYYLLPLILAILGFVWLYRHDVPSFWLYLSLFLITGVILAFYLNSTPNQPRERDYIYVISFMVFAVFTGFGVLQLATVKWQYFSPITLVVPMIVLLQNYDDHDRSGISIQMEQAKNVLNNCKPNAILFTGGDNDTFPLWYLQEVESVRTDVRIVVLSYLSAAWNIDQLKEVHEQSTGLPISLTKADYYNHSPNDYLPIIPSMKNNAAVSFDSFMNLVKTKHPAIRKEASDGHYYHFIPSKSLTFNHQSTPFTITISGNAIYKNELIILDLINESGDRPIYLNYNSRNSLKMNLDNHLVKEGFLYRFEPNTTSPYNSAYTYDYLMNKCDYPNLTDPSVYLNYEDYYLRLLTILRVEFSELIETLISEGQYEKAQMAAKKAFVTLYPSHLPVDVQSCFYVQLIHSLKMDNETKILSNRLINYINTPMQKSIRDKRMVAYVLSVLLDIYNDLGDQSQIQLIKEKMGGIN